MVQKRPLRAEDLYERRGIARLRLLLGWTVQGRKTRPVHPASLYLRHVQEIPEQAALAALKAQKPPGQRRRGLIPRLGPDRIRGPSKHPLRPAVSSAMRLCGFKADSNRDQIEAQSTAKVGERNGQSEAQRHLRAALSEAQAMLPDMLMYNQDPKTKNEAATECRRCRAIMPRDGQQHWAWCSVGALADVIAALQPPTGDSGEGGAR